MVERRQLTSPDHRNMARRMRDYHWSIMEKVDQVGTLWCCWWNKNGRHRPPCPDDLKLFGLIDGMEFLEWTKTHPDWWTIGEWSDDRYAAPVSLTDVGREALRNRHLYDMEPVTGGMVEPGWQAVPSERPAS